MTISLLALFTKLGGAIGSAVAGATWSSNMRRNMRLELPESVTFEEIEKLYQDIKAAKSADPAIREAVIRAYDRTIGPLFMAALLLCEYSRTWFLKESRAKQADPTFSLALLTFSFSPHSNRGWSSNAKLSLGTDT